ncbi:MAG: hypothetical protein K1X87_03045 [Dehalococcoidia bacterium]|nr:hypothetical protein [Dehalococcoidia bacterium]
MARGLTELLKSMTGVLQSIGFGGKAGPVVPREQEQTSEFRPPAAHELHEQVHEPERTRLERGHPKR